MLNNLNQPKGSTIGVLRDGRTIQEALDESYGVLSLQAATPTGLRDLFIKAATTGRQAIVNSSVTLTEQLSVDLQGKVVNILFLKPVISDRQHLVIRNAGPGSVIGGDMFANMTKPWVITRLTEDGVKIAPGADTVATLVQDDQGVGYQPVESDKKEWDLLPQYAKDSNVCAGFIFTGCRGLHVESPKGTYGALTFRECVNTVVTDPVIKGGKHQYGVILFDNTGSDAWGYGNRVEGGVITSGSTSGVVFMRQKGYTGGASNVVVVGVGESGIKTYQNQVNGRSARCYNLTIKNITAIGCGYDGVDAFSDYGNTPIPRVGDLYQLEQYAWNKLPTRHRISGIESTDCGLSGAGTGFTGDGQFNEYSDISVDGSQSSGIFNSGSNNDFFNIRVRDGNRNNAAEGAQVRILGVSRIMGVTIRTSSAITAGNALVVTGAGTKVTGQDLSGTTLPSVPKIIGQDSLELGGISSTNSLSTIRANPRRTLLANPCGGIDFELTLGSSGNESGNVSLRGALGGQLVKGVRAIGASTGFAAVAMAAGANPSLLQPGEFCVFSDGTGIKILAKLPDGTEVTKAL